MSGQEYTLADLLAAHRHHILQDLHTFLPGKIVKYDPTTQTADVQPMIKHVFWSGDAEQGVDPGLKVYASLPLIPNVPVEFPGAGGMVLTFPINAGDTCDIEFSEASLADYLSSGQESEPSDVGRHKLGYAVVHPVYCPTTPMTDADIVSNDRIVLGTPGGVQIQITGSNVIIGGDHVSVTDFVALSSKVDAALAKLQNAFDSHMHATAALGPPVPPTAVPGVIPVGSLASTAASVTKAK